MNMIFRLLDGFCLVGDSYTNPRVYKFDRNGFAADARNLSGDVRMVGADVKVALEKVELQHGQTYTRQSTKSKRKQPSAYAA